MTKKTKIPSPKIENLRCKEATAELALLRQAKDESPNRGGGKSKTPRVKFSQVYNPYFKAV